MHSPGLSNRHTVTLIDGNIRHQKEVEDYLLSFYEITRFTQAHDALRGLKENTPALAIVGETLAQGSGLNFIKALRQEEALCGLPVIYIVDHEDFSILEAAKAAGANAFLIKPYRRSKLINAISALLNAKVEDDWESIPTLEREALKNTVQTFNDIADVISSGAPLPFGAVKYACTPLVESVKNHQFKHILNGVREHDNYTYAHSMRVATLLSLFGNAANLSDDERMVLASGGLLHDVGKMLIPHHILNKPGRLDEAEFAIMKSHVPETVKHLQSNGEIPKPVIIIAGQHHEKLDGTGYPHGFKGAELNELARMAAIVDVFSALTDRRVYKPPMPPEQALSIMTDEMGRHLDQHFLTLFKEMLLDAVSGDEAPPNIAPDHIHLDGSGCC